MPSKIAPINQQNQSRETQEKTMSNSTQEETNNEAISPSPSKIAMPNDAITKNFADGLYTGQINKAGERNGYGFIQFKNGTTYRGEWKRNVFHGHGTFIFVHSGASYTGQWKDGKHVGKGTYRSPQGVVCEGEWKDGMWVMKNSENHPSSSDGSTEIFTKDFDDGSFQGHLNDEGSRDGYGCMNYLSGSCYKGEWKNDKFHGQGTFRYPNGTQYIGGWKHGKQEGKGIYRTAAGSWYKGEWKDGVWECISTEMEHGAKEEAPMDKEEQSSTEKHGIDEGATADMHFLPDFRKVKHDYVLPSAKGDETKAESSAAEKKLSLETKENNRENNEDNAGEMMKEDKDSNKVERESNRKEHECTIIDFLKEAERNLASQSNNSKDRTVTRENSSSNQHNSASHVAQIFEEEQPWFRQFVPKTVVSTSPPDGKTDHDQNANNSERNKANQGASPRTLVKVLKEAEKKYQRSP